MFGQRNMIATMRRKMGKNSHVKKNTILEDKAIMTIKMMYIKLKLL